MVFVHRNFKGLLSYQFFHLEYVCTMRFTLSKNDRLKSRKLIEELFAKGKSVNAFPLQMKYLATEFELDTKVQVAFSVPKRNFKNAVDRNRIKRQLRECYRLRKPAFVEQMDQSYIFMILYLGKEEPEYADLEKVMDDLLGRFIKGLNSKKKNESK